MRYSPQEVMAITTELNSKIERMDILSAKRIKDKHGDIDVKNWFAVGWLES